MGLANMTFGLYAGFVTVPLPQLLAAQHVPETIGRNNPLAATQFSVLSGVTVLPIVYMQMIDGRAYDWRGVTGAYGADAGIGLVACALLGVMLLVMHRRAKRVAAGTGIADV